MIILLNFYKLGAKLRNKNEISEAISIFSRFSP